MEDKSRYDNRKCFVLSDSGYEELTYAELCLRREQDASYKMKHFIPLYGMLLEVTSEQYREFYREKRRQKYLLERSAENRDVSIDVLLIGNLSGAALLAYKNTDVEAEAEKNILMDKLQEALQCLSIDERLLIRRHYYDELTETELADL